MATNTYASLKKVAHHIKKDLIDSLLMIHSSCELEQVQKNSDRVELRFVTDMKSGPRFGGELSCDSFCK